MMNTNSRNDPMLSSFMNEDLGRLLVLPSSSTSLASSTSFFKSPAFIISMDSLLMSPDPAPTLSDLVAAWSNDHKGVVSIKTEEDARFLASPYAPSGDIDNGDISMEEIEIGSNTTVADIKIEIEDTEFDDTHVAGNSLKLPECNMEYDAPFEDNSFCSRYYKHEENTFPMTEAAARRHVEEQFEKIAFVPSSNLSQREKIQFILAQSDCGEYSVENVLNFDKRSPDSARACARIVQNIPQRYRWECILPEDIPCCYTIVADCKKVSSRDKPPRPMNAFMIWAQGARRLINELCPKMQNALISEALGYYWRQKSDAFKKSFEQEKVKLRRFHNVEFPEYKYKPKTKVQKAKEKHELSLTKAKMRASVKREKLHSTKESNLCHRRPKCGRPRKSQSVSSRKNIASSPHREIYDQLPDTLVSTKPAIKDMLSLKILSDRRSKGANKNVPISKTTVHSTYGQLSPIEVDSPYINDIFDDMGNFNMTLVNNTNIDKEMSGGHVIPSSVYDTPANTPPVDFEHELRLSPLQPQTTSSPSSSFSSTKVTSKESSLCKSNILSSATSNNTIVKPHHSAAEISKTSTDYDVDINHKSSLGDHFNDSTTVLTNRASSNLSTSHASEFSDLLFTYVTEALSSGPMKLKYLNSSNDMNSNANSRVVNSSSQSDDNNNNIDITLSYATSFLRNSKTGTSFSESSDLDTVRLDLNSPILSDDDMRSLLNSL